MITGKMWSDRERRVIAEFGVNASKLKFLAERRNAAYKMNNTFYALFDAKVADSVDLYNIEYTLRVSRKMGDV